MALFAVRFDFRSPGFAGVSMADRYQAGIDMAEWADRLGAVSLILSEHHGSEDGYLPGALPMAAAMAARTTNVRISLAALVAAFCDPLRLAEEVAVVDLISRGRLDVFVAGGYVREEFEMFGVPMAERARRVTETVTTLKQAFAGEPFEYRGRPVRVTPSPFQPGGPKIHLGGSSEGAARRAARIADGFMPSEPEFWSYYQDEMVRLGKPDPGPYLGGDVAVVAFAEDAEAGWERLAPYFLHEMNAYGAWRDQDEVATGYQLVADLDVLAAGGQYRVVTPDQYVAELAGAGPFAFTMLHPLCGGIPPQLAWESLRLFEHTVLPRLA